jgi:ribonuclease HI
MELMACIKGVEELDHPCNLTIKSDSKYLIDALRLGWAIKWRDNGWRLSGGRRAENIDLWEILLDLLARHQVTFEWVKAHNGHLMNELCDQLAKDAANGSCLLEDVGYTKR